MLQSHRSLFQSLASLRASTKMHDAMVVRVMRAPVGWFERTPLGRILNRFSSDIQEIDKDVMEAFGSTLVCTFSAVAIVVVISYTVGYVFLSTTREANLVLSRGTGKLSRLDRRSLVSVT